MLKHILLNNIISNKTSYFYLFSDSIILLIQNIWVPITEQIKILNLIQTEDIKGPQICGPVIIIDLFRHIVHSCFLSAKYRLLRYHYDKGY